MFALIRLGAAIAVLAVVGGLFASLTGSPSPGVPPSPSPSPIAAFDGDAPLTPGATYFYDGAWFEGSPRYLFTVPGTDWSTRSDTNFGKYLAADDGGEILVTPWKPDNLNNDPCKYLSGGQVDPPVGPSVDDLVSALVTQAAGYASTPSDVTIGGYTGKRIELSLPDGLDIGSCEGQQYWRWTERGSQGGGHVYLDGQRDILYVLDLDGLRAVIAVIYQEGTSEADLAEVDDLVASIRFEWPSPSPSSASASLVATAGG